jgi:hypothetical protein
MVRVGDLVLPIEEREFLFLSPDDSDLEKLEVTEVFWDDTPGVVLEILEFDPPKEYRQIKLMVNESVGWTYSDYVLILNSH